MQPTILQLDTGDGVKNFLIGKDPNGNVQLTVAQLDELLQAVFHANHLGFDYHTIGVIASGGIRRQAA
jgi:hypothetical protein